MVKLRLSAKERVRAEVLLKVSKSLISLAKASELLGVSYRAATCDSVPAGTIAHCR